MRLTPLPAAPPVLLRLFHTVSLSMRPSRTSSVVPPQAQTSGDDAGNSACCLPSLSALLDPASPDAALYVAPRAEPAANAASMARMPCSDQWSSGAPQLMDTACGPVLGSPAAAATASTKPRSELGALYVTM